MVTEEKKKKKLKNTKKKKYSTSDKVLLGIFCLLACVVLVLFVFAIIKHQEREANPEANMVIPIFKDDHSFHFSISAKALAEERDYIFKVTNFKEKKINDQDVHYHITVDNNTDSVIKIVKNDEDNNLMTDPKKTVFKDEVFTGKEKGENTYYVTMTSHGELNDNDFIRVEVSDEENSES